MGIAIRFSSILLLFVLGQGIAFAQVYDDVSVRLPSGSIERIPLSRVLGADTSGLIDRAFLAGWDSVKTYYFNGDYWFRWRRSGRQGDRLFGIELFAYSDSTSQVWQITDHDQYWIDAYSGPLDGLLLHCGKLFVVAGSDQDDPIGHLSLLLVDPHQHRVSKEVHLRKASYIRKIYSIGDTLHIILQPQKRSLNLLHYLFFWVPRGNPEKWKFADDGPAWHVTLDCNFNILGSEESPTRDPSGIE